MCHQFGKDVKKELKALKYNNPGMRGEGARVTFRHCCVDVFWYSGLGPYVNIYIYIIYLELLNWLFLTFDCIDLSVYTLWHAPGLLRCTGKGLEFCWKADKQSVLRMVTSLRAFSHRPGQPFYARLLVTSCSGSAFMSESKSLRHLFAKDVLERLRTGDNADRLNACVALQKVKSPYGLGRFNHDIGFELSKLAHRVRGMRVRQEVRLEAVKTLAHLFPSEMAEPPGSSWCGQSPQHWNKMSGNSALWERWQGQFQHVKPAKMSSDGGIS